MVYAVHQTHIMSKPVMGKSQIPVSP